MIGDMLKIPFNKASLTGNELRYIQEAVEQGHISADGSFTKRCCEFLERQFRAQKILLTPSCTHALEIAAILLDLAAGDEVILPSFAFVTTANAFVLRGARPIFVDIRPDTLNLDEAQIAERMTSRTKAIVALHYAGVACEMDAIMSLASQHGIRVVEDAAQGVNAKYKGRFLGTIGDFAAYSFHETKNYTCGEGGALVLNHAQDVERAEIVRQKGTNRNQFFRGETDKYTWTDLGSSYVLSDVLAAFLFAQLEQLNEIALKRRLIYERYFEALKPLRDAGKLVLPVIPQHCESNFHLFHVLFQSQQIRNQVMDGLKSKGILAVFHYIPLHSSPMGMKFGYRQGQFPITEDVSGRLLRLPFYNTLSMSEVDWIAESIGKLL